MDTDEGTARRKTQGDAVRTACAAFSLRDSIAPRNVLTARLDNGAPSVDLNGKLECNGSLRGIMAADSDRGHQAPSGASSVRDLEAIVQLIAIAQDLLGGPETRTYERTLKFLAISVANSSVAVATLFRAGYGADAVRVARSMFETLVTLKYLLRRPRELNDFLEFDAIASYKRLQLYKSRITSAYARFSEEKIETVNSAYRAVRKKFTNSKGKVRERWCRHSLAEMARVADMTDWYDLFYRYASSLHHMDPRGLAMMIDSVTLEVRPGPTQQHTGIALRAAALIFYEALREYSVLVGVNRSEALARVEKLLEGEVEAKGQGLFLLAKAFPSNPAGG
jgi:hypothetical protein